MATSGARTVDAYLEELPAERRAVMREMVALIRRSLPAGYEEGVGYGMIDYVVPLSRFPGTYNGQPLCYAGLAAQKNHYSLYLMCACGDAEQARRLRDGFAREGKRLDMGKACIRFKSLDDISLDAVSRAVAFQTADQYVASYQTLRSARKPRPRSQIAADAAAKRAAAKQPAAKGGGAGRAAKRARKRARGES